MSRIYFFYFFYILSGVSLTAQTSVNHIILSARQDPSVAGAFALMEWRLQHPQAFRWIDKIELRTETKEFISNQQQYSLRINSTKWSALKATKNFESLDLNDIQLELDEALHKTILKRYEVILEYYFLLGEEAFLLTQDSFYNKKIKYLESLLHLQVQDEIKDWIQSIHKNDRLIFKKNQLILKKESLLRELASFGFKEMLSLDSSTWIGPDQIVALVSNDPSELHRHLMHRKFKLEKEKLEVERSQQKAERWDVLDFLQANWRNNSNDETLRERFSIGAAFKLPYSGSEQKDRYLFQFRDYKIKLEAEAWQREFDLKSQALRSEIKDNYQLMLQEQSRLDRFHQKFSSTTFLQVNDRLMVDESMLEMKEQVLELQQKLYNSYLEFLDHTRCISSTPLKNYFHKDLPIIQE